MVPTVRVVVTFTKFVELQPVEKFYTPLSSPTHLLNADDDDPSGRSTCLRRTSTSHSWGGGSKHQQRSSSSSGALDSDPFAIPVGYTWTNSGNDSSRKMKKSRSVRKSK